jgi:hypothetical protein
MTRPTTATALPRLPRKANRLRTIPAIEAGNDVNQFSQPRNGINPISRKNPPIKLAIRPSTAMLPPNL